MWNPRPMPGRAGAVPPATVLAIASFLSFLGTAACDGDTTVRFVDPPIDLSESAGAESADAAVAIGSYDGQAFAEWHDGSDCTLIHGFQGGVWIMPAIRIQGLSSPAKVKIRLSVDGQEPISDVSSKANFLLAEDGWLEVLAFPARIDYATWKIQELYGLDGLLEVTVVDGEGRTAVVELDVVLVEG